MQFVRLIPIDPRRKHSEKRHVVKEYRGGVITTHCGRKKPLLYTATTFKPQQCSYACQKCWSAKW